MTWEKLFNKLHFLTFFIFSEIKKHVVENTLINSNEFVPCFKLKCVSKAKKGRSMTVKLKRYGNAFNLSVVYCPFAAECVRLASLNSTGSSKNVNEEN